MDERVSDLEPLALLHFAPVFKPGPVIWASDHEFPLLFYVPLHLRPSAQHRFSGSDLFCFPFQLRSPAFVHPEQWLAPLSSLSVCSGQERTRHRHWIFRFQHTLFENSSPLGWQEVGWAVGRGELGLGRLGWVSQTAIPFPVLPWALFVAVRSRDGARLTYERLGQGFWISGAQCSLYEALTGLKQTGKK